MTSVKFVGSHDLNNTYIFTAYSPWI